LLYNILYERLFQWKETSDRITLFEQLAGYKYRVAQKTSRNLHSYNGAYTSWGKISFGTSVDQVTVYYVHGGVVCIFEMHRKEEEFVLRLD